MRDPQTEIEKWLLGAFGTCTTAIGLMKSQGKDTAKLEERFHEILKSLQDFAVELDGQMKQFLCERLATQGLVVSPEEIKVVPVPMGKTPEEFLQTLNGESEQETDPTLN
jgi:hypothetical protein